MSGTKVINVGEIHDSAERCQGLEVVVVCQWVSRYGVCFGDGRVLGWVGCVSLVCSVGRVQCWERRSTKW